MASKKLVVVAHGIGAAKEGFEQDWADILHRNHGAERFDVKGLWWEDVLDKVAEKYGDITGNLKEVLDAFGLDGLGKLMGQVGESETFQQIKDYAQDVVIYAGLPEMAHVIQEECKQKLHALCAGRDHETILIGHSLGAAMLPHIVWQDKVENQYMPYRGLILLASPLGFESPLPKAVPDLLQVMAGSTAADRITTLRTFAGAWDKKGDHRLRFVINCNDLVCSDVIFFSEEGKKLGDLIPIRQGFSPQEEQALNAAHPDCVLHSRWGVPAVRSIGQNHAAENYLNAPEFRAAFEELLKQQETP